MVTTFSNGVMYLLHKTSIHALPQMRHGKENIPLPNAGKIVEVDFHQTESHLQQKNFTITVKPLK